MKIFDQAHEKVVFFHDAASGLKAIIAIHSNRLGPALGGIRMRAYASEDEALTDALRLAEAMTFKAAAAGLPLGGGKAVILGDPSRDKSPQMLAAMGRCIESLHGRYIAAEDSGTTQEDMAVIARETAHVTGMPGSDGKRGDPSLSTARGVVLSMKVALAHARGSDDLRGVHVALAGLGAVGSDVATLLSEAKAKITVADIDPVKRLKAQQMFGADLADTDEIHRVPADIYSPCALGGGLNDKTIPELAAKIIVGSANNQLLDSRKHADMLAQRGILYAPDYIVNAGGIIKLFLDIKAGTPEARGICVEQIADTLTKVFALAKEKSITTEEAAQEMVIR